MWKGLIAVAPADFSVVTDIYVGLPGLVAPRSLIVSAPRRAREALVCSLVSDPVISGGELLGTPVPDL